MVSSNTELCPSGWQTHQRRFRSILTIAYGLILTTSPCATLTIYASTQAMRRSTKDHVRKVLQSLQQFGLYCKAEKCQLGLREVGFLRFVINSDGMDMESDRISTIEDWPTPESVCDVQVLLGFTNLYRRFIRKYAKVTAPIWILLKTQGSQKVGMNSGCRTRISKAQNGLYRSTDPPVFQPAKTNHSADRCKPLHHRRHPQPVRQIQDSSPSQFLLSKMLPRRTELRHVRSGALGDCRENETMERLSRRHQSQCPDPVWPQESRVFPNLQTALPKTGQVGGYLILLRLCHRTLGRKTECGKWMIRKTRLRDRLREADSATAGNLGSYHHWTVQWPPSRNQSSSGYRRVDFRRETQDCQHSNRRYSWPATNRQIRGRIYQRMDSHHRSSHLPRKDICTKGWPTSQQSHKPFPWQPRIRSVRSSQNSQVSVTGFPPYENTSPDANYATESTHHGTPITAQSCH